MNWLSAFAKRWRLALFGIGVAVATILAAGWTIARFDSDIYRAQKLKEMTVSAEILGRSITAALIFDDARTASQPSAAPNALILVSPAVAVTSDAWFQRLLRDRGHARAFSPDEHVREGLPPTLILQGSSDTVTPLPGV